MKIYSLSGLGVDERAFQNLNHKNIEFVHIKWIEPLKDELLEHYVNRLFESLDIPEEYNLLGVSFGGMLAIEFAKIRKPRKLFLISTITNRSELPIIFRIGGFINLHKLLPFYLMKSSNFFTNFLFGVKRKAEKQILNQILKDTNNQFLKWAVNAILKWNNKEFTDSIRIHGSKDKILPLN